MTCVPLAADEDWTKDTAQTEFRLFDGTVITIHGRASTTSTGSGSDPVSMKRFSSALRRARRLRPRTARCIAGWHGGRASEHPAETCRAGLLHRSVLHRRGGKTAAEIRAESDALAKRTEGWVYSIPGYKYDTIFRPLDQLLQPSESAQARAADKASSARKGRETVGAFEYALSRAAPRPHRRRTTASAGRDRVRRLECSRGEFGLCAATAAVFCAGRDVLLRLAARRSPGCPQGSAIWMLFDREHLTWHDRLSRDSRRQPDQLASRAIRIR